jgi:hypothetical protein
MWIDSSRFTAALATCVLGLGAASTQAQHNEEINARPNPYGMETGFLKLPAGRTIGSTVTVEIDPDGTSLWVFDRCGAHLCVGSDVAPISKFDASGNLVTSFGAGLFVRAHGLHIDFDGNVWVTDDQGPDGKDPRRDGKGHQVFKFSPAGELLMTLGTAGVAGEGPNTFNRPSAVLVAPDGSIFVGDGHGVGTNARVVKFAPDGTFIKSFGHRGTGPGEFATAHSLAMDSQGRLFVGDRENDRIQIFDQDGNFLEQWTQFGRPSDVHIDANDMIYVADSQSDDVHDGADIRPEWKEGIRIGSARDGSVTAFIADPDGDGSQEGVVADRNGVVYASRTSDMGLRRYTKR